MRRVHLIRAVRSVNANGDVREMPFTLASDIPALESALDTIPETMLIVIDPLTAYLGEADSHNNGDVRALLHPLAELAARRKVCILCISHLNKAGDRRAMYRTAGSLAFVAAARIVLGVADDPEADETATPRPRLLLPIKSNIGPEPPGIRYHVEDDGKGRPLIAWHDEPVNVDIEEALAQHPRGDGRGRPADERDAAVAFLQSSLAHGPRPAAELIEEAREGEGITKRTLDRARKDLRVEAYRPDPKGVWFWRLPAVQIATCA